ncbi:hypothetical protein GCM10027168_44490 [Streptomyces capparidis]
MPTTSTTTTAAATERPTEQELLAQYHALLRRGADWSWYETREARERSQAVLLAAAEVRQAARLAAEAECELCDGARTVRGPLCNAQHTRCGWPPEEVGYFGHRHTLPCPSPVHQPR